MRERSPAYDALLVVSFGGPEGADDVMPFLENVTRGRNVPRARLEAVAEHYHARGGVSPINAEVRDLVAALEARLAADGPPLPIYWGNRNWHPFLADTVARMAADGVRRAVAFATSAYSSYSGCRQYLEDLAGARAAVGAAAPEIEKIRPFWDHPGFIAAVTERVRDALAVVPRETDPARVRLLFSAHSLPCAMAAGCDYAAELREAAALVAARLDRPYAWDVVFQSRSGPPSQPWLEPDVVDHLRTLPAAGVRTVVVVPLGFVSDHMEVVHDLDTEAAAAARALEIGFTRARTVGASPCFVEAVRDLVLEHVEGRAPRSLAARGARPTPCPPTCCPADRRGRS